jgi:hypothetical protein
MSAHQGIAPTNSCGEFETVSFTQAHTLAQPLHLLYKPAPCYTTYLRSSDQLNCNIDPLPLPTRDSSRMLIPNDGMLHVWDAQLGDGAIDPRTDFLGCHGRGQAVERTEADVVADGELADHDVVLRHEANQFGVFGETIKLLTVNEHLCEATEHTFNSQKKHICTLYTPVLLWAALCR